MDRSDRPSEPGDGRRSFLTAMLGPGFLAPGGYLLPEEKLAVSLSLVLLIAAIIFFI